MKEEARKREQISERWEKALENYTPNNKVYVKKNEILKNKKLIYKHKDLLPIGILDLTLPPILYAGSQEIFQPPIFLTLLAGITVANVGFLTKKFLNIKYDKIALKNISKAICCALKEKNLLDKSANVNIEEINGNYEITLSKADIHCQNLFIKSLSEAISKKCNTRYLLLANDKVFNVPSIFDKNKESAEFFRKAYVKNNFTMNSKIIYSKNGIGKLEKLKLLLKQENDEINEEQIIFDGKVDIDWLSSVLGI